MTEHQLLEHVVHKNTDFQLSRLVEECSELIQAIEKFRRGVHEGVSEEEVSKRMTHFVEESEDVQLVLDQFKIAFEFPATRKTLRKSKLLKLANEFGVRLDG